MCEDDRVTVQAYTDGACFGNPGPGGWAWAVPDGAFASGSEAHTTNQRMEITAAWRAVEAIDGPLEIVSDSTYVVNCFRDKWYEGWKRRGWRNSKKEPVANRDLWEPFIDLVLARGDVRFAWVKGHGGDPWNDLVDRLAVEAADRQEGRSGTETPTDVGPADQRGRGAMAAASAGSADGLPDARRLVVMGHRPTELGGYDENPLASAIRRHLAEIIGAKRDLDPELVVLTGLRLGAETLGAEAAQAAGAPYVAVLPYPDPDQPWPESSRRRFRELLDGASSVVTLQRKAPESKQKAGQALARRDAYLARQASEALLVWDEQDAALAKLFKSLEDHLGDDVWVVNPSTVPPDPGA
jgi:ribonuclease HI